MAFGDWLLSLNIMFLRFILIRVSVFFIHVSVFHSSLLANNLLYRYSSRIGSKFYCYGVSPGMGRLSQIIWVGSVIKGVLKSGRGRGKRRSE